MIQAMVKHQNSYHDTKGSERLARLCIVWQIWSCRKSPSSGMEVNSPYIVPLWCRTKSLGGGFGPLSTRLTWAESDQKFRGLRQLGVFVFLCLKVRGEGLEVSFIGLKAIKCCGLLVLLQDI